MAVRDMLVSTGMTASIQRRQSAVINEEGHTTDVWVTIRENVPCFFYEKRGMEIYSLTPNIVIADYEVILDITESDVTEKDRLIIRGKQHDILLSTNMVDECMILKTRVAR